MEPIKQKSKINSSFWVTAALTAASVEPIIAKFAYAQGISVFQLICLKNILGALIISPLLIKWFYKKSPGILQMLPVAILLFMTNSFTLAALQSLDVVLLITIITTTPALVALSNSVLGRDKLSPTFWPGFLLCFLGIVITLDFNSVHLNSQGILFAFAAALSSTIYRVRMEIICPLYGATNASAFTFLVQGLLTCALLPLAFPFSNLALIFGSCIAVSASLANIAFVTALNLVGSTRISILTMIQRPVLILAAILLLHETATLNQVFGIISVMIGIHFAKVKRRLEAQDLPSIKTSLVKS